MIRKIKLTTSTDLKDFMNLAVKSTMDVGVHTNDNQIADAKSILGLMSIDYNEPVKVVTEDFCFFKNLDKWGIEE